MADLNKSIQIIFGAKDKTGTVFKNINSRIGTLDSSFGGLGGVAVKTSKQIALIGGALATVAGIFAGFSAKAAAEFETSIGNINTLLSGLAEEDLPAIEQGIKDIALTIPVELNDIAAAFYDIQSGTGAGADGLEILEVAAKAAVGGLSTTKSAASALITVLNSYGLSAEDAERISDIMFATVKEGVLTFGDLASEVGKVAATGKAANQSFETTGAAIATLTGLSGQQSESFTKLESVYGKLSTKKVAEGFAEFGIDIRDVNDRLRPLKDIIGDVAEQQLSFQQILEIFPRKEAATAILMLSQNYESFTKKLEATNNSTGVAENAFQKMADTFNSSIKLLKNTWSVFLVTVGDPIIKQLSPILDKLGESMKSAQAEAAAGEIGKAFANWIEGISDFIEKLNEVSQGLTGIEKASLLIDFTKWSGDIETIKASLTIANNIVGGIALSVAGVHDLFVPIGNFIATSILSGLYTVFAILVKIMKVSDMINPFVDMSDSIAKMEQQTERFKGGWQQGIKELFSSNQLWSDDVAKTIVKVNSAIESIDLERLALPGANTSTEKVVLDAIRERNREEEKLLDVLEKQNKVVLSKQNLADLESIANIKDKTKALEIFNAVLTETQSKDSEKIFTLRAEVDTASIEAGAEMFKALMGTISTGIDSTGNLMGKLADAIPEAQSSKDKKRLTKAFDADAINRGKAFDQTFSLGSQQIQLNQLKIDRLTPKKTPEQIKLAAQTKKFNDILNNPAGENTFGFKKLVGETAKDLDVSFSKAKTILAGEADAPPKESKTKKEREDKVATSQIKVNEAKAERLASGEAIISISADGLEPELEAFMWQVVERIQIRANAEGAEYLLGV